MTDDRAEQAFRTALTDRADALMPTVLDVPASRRHRRWPLLVAAAAAIVMVVGLVLVVAGHRDEATPSHVLPDGWRWESYRDVMVAVPSSWDYAYAPTDQWCVSYDESDVAGGGGLPREGYVNLGSPAMGGTDVACPSNVPPEPLFAVHLSFLGSFDPEKMAPGWSNLTRTIHGTTVAVVTDEQHRTLAGRVLATAHAVTTDQNGCDTTSPIQQQRRIRPPAFDVASLHDVDTIAVCQYDLLGTSGPGLSASRQLTGQSARDELGALQSAPIGGGPDRPGSCLHSMWDDAGLVLRLTTADGTTRDMYAYYDGCFDNGIDDGTHVRELTTANCRPLFGERLRDLGGIPTAFDRCVTRGG